MLTDKNLFLPPYISSASYRLHYYTFYILYCQTRKPSTSEKALCPICSIILYIMARNGAVKEDIIAAWDLYALAVSVPIVIYWWFFLGREGNGNIVPRFIPRRHVVTQKHTQQKKGKKHTQRKNRK